MRHLHSLLAIALIATTSTAAFSQTSESSIPSLTKIGIANKIEKQTFQWSTPNQYAKYDAYVLRVNLGVITQAQFTTLKQRYGNLSEVNYDPAKKYELTDFLSPVMQAVDQKQFRPSLVEFPWPAPQDIEEEDGVEIADLIKWANRKQKIQISINCWGTSLSTLRDINQNARQLELGWLSRTSIGTRLSSEDMFDRVDESNVKFGDIMMIRARDEASGETLTQHTAIIVEPGLVFEKTDSSADDAFRLSYQRDVVAKMNEAFKKKIKIAYYRLKPGSVVPSAAQADTALSDYKEVYGRYISDENLAKLIIGFEYSEMTGKPEAQPSILHTVSLIKDQKSGRYVVDPANTESKNFVSPAWSK